MEQIRYDFAFQYDTKDAIGRRYRRQDAIGTPYCVTIDHQTLEDNTVTIRDRDTMAQERVSVAELIQKLHEKVDLKHLLKKIG